MLLLALSLLYADSSHALKVSLSPTESLYVESSGAGQPVVLIPGLFGSAFGFRKVVPLLVEAGYRAVIIEPLGIGQSSRPSKADYSMMAQADRISSAIDSLGLQDVILVAHSLGGAIAFRMAYRHPERLKGMISIEGGPTERTATSGFRRVLKFASILRVFGGAGLVRRKIKGSLINASGDPSWVTDSVVRGYTSSNATNMGGTLKGYLAMSSADEPEPLAPHLTEIHIPARLIVGTAEHEGDVSAEEVAELQRSLRSFGVDSVAGAGHFIQEERPQGIMISIDRLQQALREEATRKEESMKEQMIEQAAEEAARGDHFHEDSP